MAFYGNSKIQAEDHMIFDEPVRPVGSDPALENFTQQHHLSPSLLLPPKPVRDDLYAQDIYAASVGAGDLNLKQRLFYRNNENVVRSFVEGAPNEVAFADDFESGIGNWTIVGTSVVTNNPLGVGQVLCNSAALDSATKAGLEELSSLDVTADLYVPTSTSQVSLKLSESGNTAVNISTDGSGNIGCVENVTGFRVLTTISNDKWHLLRVFAFNFVDKTYRVDIDGSNLFVCKFESLTGNFVDTIELLQTNADSGYWDNINVVRR